MTEQPDEVERPPGLRAGFHAHLDRAGIPGLVHAGDQRAPTSWLIRSHVHEVWELYLQTDGPPTRWRVGAQEYDVPRFALLAVPPGVIHHMVRPAATVWEFMFAAIDVQILLARFPEVRAAWTQRATALPVFLPDATAAVAPFEAFLREVTTSQSLRNPGLVSTAEHLMVEVTRLLTADGSGQHHLAMHRAVAHARRVLETRYADGLRLADLAREVGMSPNYLAEIFAEQTGMSPLKYQARVRIRRAETLLVETDRTVTQIAAELGFSSAQHFATAFRQHTGRTPRAFRQAAGRAGST